VVGPAPTVHTRFGVPLAELHLRPCEALNAQLEALFLDRETADYRNPMPSHLPQEELFESRFNLFRWPDACVQQLRAFMLDGVAQTVLRTTDLTPQDLAHLKFHNHTWFHITRHAGSFVAHNHPMASWSAVYCVRAGEAVPAQPDSGVLRLADPRGGANAYRDPANQAMHPAFALRPVELRLVPGQLVVFPSYVFHEVSPFFGTDLRITVATNCWFAQ
jgi:hypothetical protein